MLAIPGSTLVVASTEKHPQPHTSSLEVEEKIVLVEEVVELAEDPPPDGGLWAWLVVFGVSSTVQTPHFTVRMLTAIFCLGLSWHGCHNRPHKRLGGECDRVFSDCTTPDAS